MLNSDIIELDDLIYHYSTIKCHVVSTEEDTFDLEADRIFLPKSMVEMYDKPGGKVFLMPEHLAYEKDLI